jgi:uncharacterized Zn finger protein
MGKKILVYTLCTFGVLFLIQVAGLVYLVVADPFNLRPLVSLYLSAQQRQGVQEGLAETSEASLASAKQDTSEVEPATDGVHTVQPTPQQMQVLEEQGLDVDAVESALTPETVQCLTDLFGVERVEEVQAGAVPTPEELVRGVVCL